MTYTPNFSDPRVVKRLTQAWNYALANLSETKPRQWGTRQIDRWFGYQHTDIGNWLRSQLLTVSNNTYNKFTGQAKEYLLNVEGIESIGSVIGKSRSNIPCANDLKPHKIAAADAIYGKTIESGVFEYRDKSERLWNDIQNLDNEIRKPLFANYGYIHEYDIKSSAPTILTQLARRIGIRGKIRTVDEYLQDPEKARQRIAALLGVNRKTAKRLITSRFAGARFGKENAIFRELNHNWLQHNRLMTDPWFAALSKDIKKIWDAIKQSEGYHRLNSHIKWQIYFREEKRVMSAVHRFLERTSNRYFHEHDGWRCTQPVQLRALQLHIEKQTDYWIEFDHDVFEADKVPCKGTTRSLDENSCGFFVLTGEVKREEPQTIIETLITPDKRPVLI